MSHPIRVAVLLAAFACAGEAISQDSQPANAAADSEQANRGVTEYPAAFFADLGVVTAQDMVRLLPGFAFQNSDDSRGYAGAGGNVLINGRRPSTKSTRLQEILQRIPASSVERIEVIRGSAPDIDMQGQPIVANIVRTSGVSSTGALQGVGKFYTDGKFGGLGRLEQSRGGENLFVESSIELRKERDDNEAGEGPATVVDPAGNVVEEGTFVADNWTTEFQGLGTLQRETQDGLFRANVALKHDRKEKLETTDLQDALGNATGIVVNTDVQDSGLEIGADYDAALNEDTGYQVVAVQTFAWEEIDSTRASNELQVANEKQQSGETILRGQVRRRISTETRVEFGAEGAFNFLDSDSTLTSDGVVINLPAANVEVEELRGEIFASLTLQPSTRTSIELGLRGEKSQISVSGDADAENDFSFIKPRFVAAYAAEGGDQIRFRIEREVGQLDFQDFAAGSELGNNTVNAGNPDLAPESAWVYEGAYERALFGDSSASFTYRHYQIQDVVDLIPVDGFAAPGNIGDGTRDEITLSLSLPLESVGPGLGRLQFSGTWRDSDVVDPVTGESRGISGEPSFEGEALYSRDFPSLNGTFGMRGELTSKKTDYRLNQVITTRNESYWRVYWDWRAKPELQVRFQVENATARDRWRHRTLYDDLRSDGEVTAREQRSAVLDPFLVVRVRWTF